ncbi:hypothetical protein L1887_39178 [Cichorium endivia]|nr:hypothetical protein L1887_39178 [Cichorium endivia]
MDVALPLDKLLLDSMEENWTNSCASLKVMLVCGSDLLESFGIPGVWIPEQVRSIYRDYGVVCIRREGQDIEKIISSNDILTEYRNNIEVVDEIVPNRISSTLVSAGFVSEIFDIR